jgi:CRISPR-associated protein Csx17
MSAERHVVELGGCCIQPLGSYLKALGIFRIIAEQIDPEVVASWKGNCFNIISIMNVDDLIEFLAGQYKPTPIIAPWNGASGFYPKDNKEALDWVRKSDGVRLASYRETLQCADRLMATISKKPSKDDKERLLQACRASFPDNAVDWLDAAFVLGTETPKYPPLLGTGGNDGHLEFTNNFIQRLADVMDESGKARPSSVPWLRSSLFGELRSGMLRGPPIGQFNPAGSGGTNTLSGFEGESLVNPWDYVLMIEGSLFFASGVVRKGETNLHGELSYPFSVKSSGVGYGSASRLDVDMARAELWVPIWSVPSRYPELRALFSEGRSNVEGRKAVDGVDFVRAVATLGVDRGIDFFQRYGFLMRNGRSFFAVPLGQYEVKRNPHADLLAGIDTWLSAFRSRASDDKAPASIKRTLIRLETAILDLCTEESPWAVQSMLIALGECERALCVSSRWANDQHIWPVPALPPEWLTKGDDGSPELRIAAAVALVSADDRRAGRLGLSTMRETVEPVIVAQRTNGAKVSWDDKRNLLSTDNRLVELLNILMRARIMEHIKASVDGYLDRSQVKVGLSDISAFLDGRVDEDRVVRLFWGLVLLDPFSHIEMSIGRSSMGDYPGAAFSLLKLCHVRDLKRIIGRDDRQQVPLVPEIHHRASLGNLEVSTRKASRRLRGSGLEPKIKEVRMSPQHSVRLAAALLMPIDNQSVRIIAENTLMEMK